jgi:hypothetical protein
MRAVMSVEDRREHTPPHGSWVVPAIIVASGTVPLDRTVVDVAIRRIGEEPGPSMRRPDQAKASCR